jgi:uncharacterized membrane protein YfcA
MNTTTVLIGLIVFLAAFTQSLSGFGLALVAMALLPAVIGIRLATPLVALVAIVIEVVLIIRYHESLQVHAIWRVVLAALIGIPLGVLFLSRIDESVALTLLGVVIAGYALYALFGLKLPRLENSFWAYLSGFLGGVLGGAYNTSGPPVIVYGDCRRWSPVVFKSNLQGYFIISSLVVAGSHALNGNFTPLIWRTFWWSLPFIGIGLLAGLSLDRWLNPAMFRRVVLILLVLMGVRLMV